MPNQYWVDHLNWSVYWRKKGKWVRKRFRDDFPGALKFFLTKLEMTPTLHSDNRGWPPPKRITAYERVSWKVVSRGGKKYKKRVVTVVNLMREYNDKGVWWCPYCVKLRPFKLMQTDRGPSMYCPVCTIDNYDFHVRKHNPKAAIIEQAKIQRRTSAKSRRRRSR